MLTPQKEENAERNAQVQINFYRRASFGLAKSKDRKAGRNFHTHRPV